jgi:hypothetical protein
MATLSDRLKNNTANIYFDEGFLHLIETHLGFLKSLPATTRKIIHFNIAKKFDGDFYGLLAELFIEKEFHYPILRVNGLSASNDYRGENLEIILPPLEEIRLLLETYMTKKEF